MTIKDKRVEKTYIDLMRAVGQHLSGKKLIIRDRIPGTEGRLGEIHKDLEGTLIIDISPNIPTDQKRLDVFLHEVAHAKHHNYLRSDYYKVKPGTVRHESLDHVERSKEGTAEKSAKEWREYALSNADKRLMEADTFIAGLIALLTYPEGKKHE